MSGASDILRERAEHPFDAGMAAEWPLMPDPRISDDAYYRRLSAAYSHRLRTTADALRERAEAVDWIFACFPALTEVLTAEQIASLGQGGSAARAILAQLRTERLI